MKVASQKRRAILRAAVGGVVGAACSTLANSAIAAEPLTITPLANDINLISGAGGNVVVLSTADGQVMVDSGAAAFSDVLIETLRELPSSDRIHTLFNTHWHKAQTGSNATIGQSGARIIAHEKTRLHLATDFYLPDQDRYELAQPVAAHPTESFFTGGETVIGGQQIAYGHLLEAHTDGDIFVRFGHANVLVVGDVVSPEVDPVLDWFGGGWIGGRVDALEFLLDNSDDSTRFVPSVGPVVGRAEVLAEYELMSTLFGRLVELIRQGNRPEDSLAAGVMDGLSRNFDDPMKFVYAAQKSLWAHHNTLSHDIV